MSAPQFVIQRHQDGRYFADEVTGKMTADRTKATRFDEKDDAMAVLTFAIQHSQIGPGDYKVIPAPRELKKGKVKVIKVTVITPKPHPIPKDHITTHALARLLLAQKDLPLSAGFNIRFGNNEPIFPKSITFVERDGHLVMDTAVLKTKYTDEEMTAAFDLVKNKKHWKNPIRATIDKSVDQELLTEAVTHFTGSIPEFTPWPGNRILVEAAGYYATIGA